MKINWLYSILLIFASLFFASWIFWMPKYGNGSPLLLWSVSIAASTLGVMFTYGLIIMMIFNPTPFTVKDEGLVVEEMKMFPPGIKKMEYKYEWMNRFSYRFMRPYGDRGLSYEYFEIVPSHKAPTRLRKKRRIKIYIQGNYDGSTDAIVNKVNSALKKRRRTS